VSLASTKADPDPDFDPTPEIAMDLLIERLQALSSAEDFFAFFGVPFDEQVVRVNRLHILKRFYQYLQQGSIPVDENEIEQFKRYRTLLGRAYQDFVISTPAREKVFKVFQDAGGTQHVKLTKLRDSLPARDASPSTL
jgi:nitrogenase-stabilizing/protective protein